MFADKKTPVPTTYHFDPPPPNIRFIMKIHNEKRNMLWVGDYRAVCGSFSARAQCVDVVTGECRVGHAERPTDRELHGG
jgi:hypothetical protein